MLREVRGHREGNQCAPGLRVQKPAFARVKPAKVPEMNTGEAAGIREITRLSNEWNLNSIPWEIPSIQAVQAGDQTAKADSRCETASQKRMARLSVFAVKSAE